MGREVLGELEIVLVVRRTVRTESREHELADDAVVDLECDDHETMHAERSKELVGPRRPTRPRRELDLRSEEGLARLDHAPRERMRPEEEGLRELFARLTEDARIGVEHRRGRQVLTVFGEEQHDAEILDDLADLPRDGVEEPRRIRRRLGERAHRARENSEALFETQRLFRAVRRRAHAMHDHASRPPRGRSVPYTPDRSRSRGFGESSGAPLSRARRGERPAKRMVPSSHHA